MLFSWGQEEGEDACSHHWFQPVQLGRGEKCIQIGKEMKLALFGEDMTIFVEILQNLQKSYWN